MRRSLLALVVVLSFPAFAIAQAPSTTQTLTGTEGYLGSQVSMTWVDSGGPNEGGGRWQGQTTSNGVTVTMSLNGRGTVVVSYFKQGTIQYTACQTQGFPAPNNPLVIPGLVTPPGASQAYAVKVSQ